MSLASVVLLIIPILTAAGAVRAQATPVPPSAVSPWRPADPARAPGSSRDPSTADAHRLEMDRLRGVANSHRDLARDQGLQTRRSLDALEMRRGTAPASAPVRITTPPVAPLPPPADTRPAAGTGQIDAWLARRPEAGAAD